MTAEWFFEDELSRLRWEWVSAMREYARHRSEASLARVRTSCDAYTQRVAQLRRAEQGIGAGAQRVSDTAT
jgi:hypothetical protein